MTSEPASSQDPKTSPHPTLDSYYEDADKKSAFVKEIFNDTARFYDRVEAAMALGSGPWYRRRTLVRAGLRRRMEVLDVAMGTGLVAREAIKITGSPDRVTGLDPSIGMMSEARKSLAINTILGRAEQLPCPDDQFDFLSMGYALRHVDNLETVFREYFRVLKPGGRLCILEIARPKGRIKMGLLRIYMKVIVPIITRLLTRHGETERLWRYYWETIQACVDPEIILETLKKVGFSNVKQQTDMGIFFNYTGEKPST